MCAMASKSCDWDVRNVSKISPKMAEKQSFSTFFDFLKYCPYDSNEIFYSHSTSYLGPLCVLSSNSYGWESSESQGKRPKLLYRICASGNQTCNGDFCLNCAIITSQFFCHLEAFVSEILGRIFGTLVYSNH